MTTTSTRCTAEHAQGQCVELRGHHGPHRVTGSGWPVRWPLSDRQTTSKDGSPGSPT